MITLENIVRRGLHEVNVVTQSSKTRPLGWQAFLNFLQFAGNPHETWNRKWLDDFFHHALMFPFWLERFESLVKEVRWNLLNLQQQTGWDLGFEDDLWPSRAQIISIESEREIQAVIENWVFQMYQPRQSFKIRVLPDGSEWYAFVWDEVARRMRVHLFDRQFMISGGQLKPLRRRFHLTWASSGELLESESHFWSLGPYVWVRLEGYQGLWNVRSCRGYSFLPFKSVHQKPLPALGSLFWRIKRVESFFIKKESDPLYRQLLAEAELLLKNQNRWSALLPQCQDLLVRVQEALEWVWPDDPFLKLLRLNLEKVLPQPHGGSKLTVLQKDGLWEQSDSTDSWLGAESPVAGKPMS